MTKTELYKNLDKFFSDIKKTNKKPLVVILGPTASGKTGLSIELAKKYNAEIISVDSRQVYKYMDIGTAKITKEEMQGIKHFMLDVVEPDKTFNLADFLKQARGLINQIFLKKKVPFLVGGTGLYISALIENYKIGETKPDYALRKKLEEELDKNGQQYLYEKLKKIDPKSAQKIHPNNLRYVMRALEINLTTQKPKEDLKGKEEFKVFKIGIDWPREELYERINNRVDEQIKNGLIEEVKSLLEKGYDENLPSMSGIGYKEIIPYINGKISLHEAKETLKQNTRNYAKRQVTWFRRYKDINWIDPI